MRQTYLTSDNPTMVNRLRKDCREYARQRELEEWFENIHHVRLAWKEDADGKRTVEGVEAVMSKETLTVQGKGDLKGYWLMPMNACTSHARTMLKYGGCSANSNGVPTLCRASSAHTRIRHTWTCLSKTTKHIFPCRWKAGMTLCGIRARREHSVRPRNVSTTALREMTGDASCLDVYGGGVLLGDTAVVVPVLPLRPTSPPVGT